MQPDLAELYPGDPRIELASADLDELSIDLWNALGQLSGIRKCTSPEYFGQEGAFVKRRFMVLA